MFTYMTPSDSGRGDEGVDSEAEGMGQLFDYPMDDPDTTFDVEPDRPFAFDGGVGQLIADQQLEQLTADRARELVSVYDIEQSGLGSLGLTASTISRDKSLLPPAPEGEEWVMVRENIVGRSMPSYDWETRPIAKTAKPSPVVDNFVALVKKHKAISAVTAAATVGALWWLFLRDREAE